ncbi:MAG: M1 family metallopeptidase [Croceibacterium sp.]
MKRIAAPALTAFLLAGCATAPLATTAPPAPVSAPALTTSPIPDSIPSDLPRTARPLNYAIDFTPDAQAMTFTGRESVTLEVFQPTDKLVLHAVELDVTSAKLLATDGSGTSRDLTIAAGADGQTVSFGSSAPIQPGTWRLDLAYKGKINTQAMGLFALDYPDKLTGEPRRALFTQFEAPDARRFAPMLDEPSYKATFDLTATVPTGQMPIGNMPIAAEEDLGNGFKRVKFRTSPKMSSYLLFFGMGDFERLTRPGPGGMELGIVGPKGSGEQSRYALESLPPVLTYLEDYFGVPFPLPKLDNIAGPGQSQFFGAMENWGAIFTFERILLEDPAITSAAVRQQIFDTQAHEVAHQWFGNIVTMAWWDDLWLNEGFASWMQTRTTQQVHPEWHPLLSRVGGRESAMGLDSFVTTHPVVQEIRTVAELGAAFDTIAYQKGEAIISMLEAYAGEDTWRNGIRTYVKRHQYGNTVSDDLWGAVEQAGAKGLTTIAHDFTRQPGVPLVIAESVCANGQTTLTLRQSEFSRDRMAEVATKPQRWHVPLLVQSGNAAPIRQVLDGTATLQVPGCAPVIVNGGQLGYFRTLYTPQMNGQLAKAMPTLQPIDQLGLSRDAFALAQAGYQDLAPAMDMLAAMPADANQIVAQSAINRWSEMHTLLADDAQKAKLAAMARTRFLPRMRALGFEPRANEPLVDANLRSELISRLGAMGDADVAQQARTRFARLASDPRAMDGPLKTTWLAIAARNATAAEWDLLAKLARESKSAVEQQAYYRQLGSVMDPVLAQRALDLALTGEAGTSSAAIISAVATNHPELAFDFAQANRAKVEALVDSSARANFFARLGSASKDEGMIKRLEALRASMPQDERRPVDQVLVSLRQKMDSEPRQRAQLAAWLAKK